MVEHFVQQMKYKFKISLLGELTYFLGLQVRKMEDIIVSQIKYAKSIMNKYGIENASHERTLAITHVKVTKYEKSVNVYQNTSHKVDLTLLSM